MSFVIEVVLDLFVSGTRRRDAVFRHVNVRGPKDGVENYLAKIVILPGHMVVSAGETEAAPPAVGSVIGPSNVLAFAILHRFADRGIPAARSIGPFERFRPRKGGEDRGDTCEIGNETHVIVPFVVE